MKNYLLLSSILLTSAASAGTAFVNVSNYIQQPLTLTYQFCYMNSGTSYQCDSIENNNSKVLDPFSTVQIQLPDKYTYISFNTASSEGKTGESLESNYANSSGPSACSAYASGDTPSHPSFKFSNLPGSTFIACDISTAKAQKSK